MIWRIFLRVRSVLFVGVAVAAALLLVVAANDQSFAQDAAEPIRPGTVITMQNWQRYQEYMPEGLKALFSGKLFWKFPADFQMNVGPVHNIPLPPLYLRNTEKYAAQVKIVALPDGGHSLTGYVAGQPFPNPTAPLKGWKILVNSWYAYVPHIECAPNNHVYLVDRFGNESSEVTSTVYRQFNFNSDPDVPTSDPTNPGIYYAEYTRVLEPEQSKYTTQLTLYYTDPTKPEDLFLFIPALRRSLRLSTNARCSPFVGTDWTQDDVKQEFNGGIVRFDANYLGDRRILELTTADAADSMNMNNYSKPLLFPGPKVGAWEVRDNYNIDVRRIPSESAGYCFGKRILYIDKQTWMQTWCDLYDANMKFWKPFSFQVIKHNVPGVGVAAYTGDYLVGIWDEQNDHMSAWITNQPFGTNSQCKGLGGINYTDAKLYSSVGGLSSILQ